MNKDKVTFTKTVTINRGDIPSDLIDDLKKVGGLPPYDGTNPCRGDAYFWMSIERKYNPEMIKAAQKLVIEPMRREYDAAMTQLRSKFK